MPKRWTKEQQQRAIRKSVAISTPKARRGGLTRSRNVRLDKMLGRSSHAGQDNIILYLVDAMERGGDEAVIAMAQKDALRGRGARLGPLSDTEMAEVLTYVRSVSAR